MAVTITVEGADELIGKLTTLAQMNKVRAAIGQQAIFLQRKMRRYPTKVYSPNPLIRSDPRVRRGFFYHLHHGDIKVPYKRSRTLANRWSVEQSMGGWTATVGNITPYAELVQGDEQVKRHQWSGWLTTKGAANVYGPAIREKIAAALEKEVANV